MGERPTQIGHAHGIGGAADTDRTRTRHWGRTRDDALSHGEAASVFAKGLYYLIVLPDPLTALYDLVSCGHDLIVIIDICEHTPTQAGT